jgi:hypothetical protein
MKTRKLRMKFFFLLMALFLLSLGSAFAGGNEIGNGRKPGGNELGNGGDLYAQEFTAIGRSLVERFREHSDARIPDVDALERAVNATTVATKDQLELNSAEVDAINYPDWNRIELNRKRWAEYDKEKKSALVLHEYLGIARSDDSHYQISHTFSDLSIPQERRAKVDVNVRTVLGGSGYLKTYSGNQRAFGGSLAYRLNDSWSLGAGVDYVRESDPSGFYESKTFLGLFGKYDFARRGVFQPFVSLCVSDIITNSHFPAYDSSTWAPIGGTYTESNENDKAVAIASLGTTIWLFRQVGLDAEVIGGQVFYGGLFGRYNTFYAGRAGLRVQL